MIDDLRGLHLHIDGVSGIAGDMTLGALLDLGVPIEVVKAAIVAVGLDGERLSARRVVKAGIAAIDVKVATKGAWRDAGHTPEHDHHDHDHHDHDHHDHDHHDHDHHDRGHHDHGHRDHDHHDHDHVDNDHHHDHAQAHAHHHYAAIRARIVAAALGEDVRRRALDIFDRVAVAEAKLHGTTVAAVAFHEVGAIDSIVDIVGTAAALAYLAPAAVTCVEIAVGHGSITCAHGVLPVPSPAALEILRGCGGVTTDGGVARELTTPTGAAILAHAVTAWTPAPAGVPVAIGWGAGDWDLPDRANVVRVTASRPRPEPADTLWRIEANVDDLAPELAAHAIEHALAAGAVDAWWTPITMKKGRPALAFAALAPGPARDRVVAAILRETSTIGVRYDRVLRTILDRSVVEVETEHGPISIKVARGDDGAIVNAAPEHDACAAAAAATGVPLKLVYAAAIAAWHRRTPA